MSAEDNVRVSFGVKELLGQINEKLARIDDKLDAKADLRDVVDLKSRIERMERREEARNAIERDRKDGFSKREKVIGLGLAALAVMVQLALLGVYLHAFPGGHG